MTCVLPQLLSCSSVRSMYLWKNCDIPTAARVCNTNTFCEALGLSSFSFSSSFRLLFNCLLELEAFICLHPATCLVYQSYMFSSMDCRFMVSVLTVSTLSGLRASVKINYLGFKQSTVSRRVPYISTWTSRTNQLMKES